MQAYHPVASREHAFRNEAPLLRQQQHPYNTAPQRLPASMNSKQLDTWTLYELAREKQNMMQFDGSSRSKAKNVGGSNASPSHHHDATKKKKKRKKKTAQSSQKKKSQHVGSTVAAQPVSSSIESEEMDPWTLYELEQETQEQKTPKSKSTKAKKQQTVALSSFLDTHKTKKRTNSSRTKGQQDDKKIGLGNSHTKNNSRPDPWSPQLRESVESTRKSRYRNVLLPLGRTYPEHIRQRIALAKCKRKNLLSEVNHKLYLYKGPRRSRNSSINSLLEDCNASLPNILLLDEEDSDLRDLAFELPGEEDEDDNHSSCYF